VNRSSRVKQRTHIRDNFFHISFFLSGVRQVLGKQADKARSKSIT
jgi:hypothetical protein